jgi:hypothetical protein
LVLCFRVTLFCKRQIDLVCGFIILAFKSLCPAEKVILVTAGKTDGMGVRRVYIHVWFGMLFQKKIDHNPIWRKMLEWTEVIEGKLYQAKTSNTIGGFHITDFPRGKKNVGRASGDAAVLQRIG